MTFGLRFPYQARCIANPAPEKRDQQKNCQCSGKYALALHGSIITSFLLATHPIT